MEEKEKDLKVEKETPEEESDLNKTTLSEDENSTSKEDDKEVVENPEDEEPKITAEELLSDGTSKKKKVVIPFDKFKEINEESALYKAFSPLLVKLRDNPNLVDQLIDKREGETTEQRLSRLEEGLKEKRRLEMTDVITNALKTWSDFKTNWKQIQPIALALEKQGLSYAEAIQRAYFATNPDAPRTERIVAEQVQNRQGVFGSGASYSLASGKKLEKIQIEWGEEDEEMRKSLGLSVEQYSRHWKHVKDLV